MAQGWIKYTTGFARKPEVLRIAAQLGISRHAAAGILMEKVYGWLDETIETSNIDQNGHAVVLMGPSPMQLFDAQTEVPGLADAMSAAGWLKARSDSLVFPNFSRHNGSTAKARALDTARKRNATTDPAPIREVSGSKPDENRTRLEEIREELQQQQHAGEAVLSLRTKPGKSVKPDESDPDAALIAHVCNCIAATMRLPALRPIRNEPQTVEPNVRAWLARPAPTIHGQVRTMREVVMRAAEEAAKSELGGTVKGALSWCESVIDRACRDQVWPGEFKAAKKTGVTIERPPEVPEYKTPEERQRERRERERTGQP